jgi:hypothetical protein
MLHTVTELYVGTAKWSVSEQFVNAAHCNGTVRGNRRIFIRIFKGVRTSNLKNIYEITPHRVLINDVWEAFSLKNSAFTEREHFVDLGIESTILK